MEKDNQIFGIRAIIEAINAKKEIDKVFVQKDAQGDLMQDLMKTMKTKFMMEKFSIGKGNKIQGYDNWVQTEYKIKW